MGEDPRSGGEGPLALHFHEAGFCGEVGIAGAFEFAAFLDGFGAKDFTKQVVAGFPFSRAFAFGVILEGEGAIGIVCDKAVAVAAGVLKCLADDCRLDFRSSKLANGLGLGLGLLATSTIDEANTLWPGRAGGQAKSSNAGETHKSGVQFQDRFRPNTTPCATALMLLQVLYSLRSQDDNLGTHGHTQIEIGNILIEHANTAGGHGLADGGGIIGAVNAIQSIGTVGVEIKSAGA